MYLTGIKPTHVMTNAIAIVDFGKRKTQSSTGRYIAIKSRLTGFLCSEITLPRMKYPINTGISVIARPAEAAMAYVLVYASGANIRPSCASKMNTGKKLTVIINKLKNNAGPTSLADVATIFQRFWFS